MIKLFFSVPYILFLSSLLFPIAMMGQQKDSDQFPSPGRYWIAIGEDFQGAPVNYRQFNRNSKCDDCSELLELPFSFYFYGEEFDQVYLNANGNISFGAALSEYTPSDFCLEGPMMIAPFYADVDIYECGSIQYYMDEHSLIVTWTDVCHYLAEEAPTELKNTFQLILTDGYYTHIREIALPQRASVIFNYQDMQWTTGHSSGGQEGFMGQPATVGVNYGDGERCFAYGSFDKEGVEFNNQQAGGVSHLDYRYIAWNGREGELASQSLANPFAASDSASILAFSVEAYPNPTSDQLQLDLSAEAEAKVLIQLTDMSGRLVYKTEVLAESGDLNLQIPTASLATGLYYLSVRFQEQLWYKKIAKI